MKQLEEYGPLQEKIISIKKIKLYICKNRQIKITFRNYLIFWEDKLSTIKFRE